jgi:hypothetical protein
MIFGNDSAKYSAIENSRKLQARTFAFSTIRKLEGKYHTCDSDQPKFDSHIHPAISPSKGAIVAAALEIRAARFAAPL